MPARPRAPSAPALLQERLGSQLLGAHRIRAPEQVVRWMGAVQAQDLGASRWAIGVRLPRVTDAEVGRALSEGAILRTHLFRGTLQLVAPCDVRWMLDLVAARMIAGQASREAALGLDARVFRRSRAVLARALAGGVHLTRAELAERLARAGVRAGGVQLSHLLQRAELEGLVCSGSLREGALTFALLDERAPPARAPLTREEALRELAVRHARGRGPVRPDDLAWWAGLGLREARAALEAARPALEPERVGGELVWRAAETCPPPPPGAAHLLPAFDEYLVGYRDRSAMVAGEHLARINNGGGILSPCAAVDGKVLGRWARHARGRTLEVAIDPFERLAPASRRALEAAARRYAVFLGKPEPALSCS